MQPGAVRPAGGGGCGGVGEESVHLFRQVDMGAAAAAEEGVAEQLVLGQRAGPADPLDVLAENDDISQLVR